MVDGSVQSQLPAESEHDGISRSKLCKPATAEITSVDLRTLIFSIHTINNTLPSGSRPLYISANAAHFPRSHLLTLQDIKDELRR